MALIDLQDVGLTFRVRKNTRVTWKEYFISQLFRKSQNPIMEVKALQDVTLHVQQGERLGIVGHNGAGKSTLLKVLAGIYPPTTGRMTIQGRISSLFDITLGFEADASGWDNIAYRSYLQGETPRTVRQKKDAIAAFSELGTFLDMPVRYYSAGMLVRLAFSIATAIEPEILLVDEVLSVGDMAFQVKAQERMREMMAKAHLMVVISHDLKALGKMCNLGVWMNHGRVAMTGPIRDVIAAYKASVGQQDLTPPKEEAA